VKLNDLIDALGAEIERTQPELERVLERLAVLDADDDAFIDALDKYNGQAQRMGEAAEVTGFDGLQAVCVHVVENTLLMATQPTQTRGPLLKFLRGWPPLVVHYLRNLADPTAAAGLVDHLCQAPNPLDDERALKIAHMLGAMDGQVHATFTDQETARPVLASPEDVALVIPDDVDRKLLEGFFTEAPDQTRYLVELARNMVSGESDSSDLIAAKRVVHTLKGSGSIIGLRGLASLGHNLEDILEHFERHQSQVAKPVADALLNAAYCLEQMVGYVVGTDEYPQQSQAVLQAVLDLANRIDRGEEIETPLVRVGVRGALSQESGLSIPLATTLDVPAVLAPKNRRMENQGVITSPTAALRVSVTRIDELFRVSGEVSVHTAAMEVRLKTLTKGARALLAQNLRVQKRLLELEAVVDVRALTVIRARGGRSDTAAFDPLEMDQYSELHSATHALAEEATDARALANRLEEEIARTHSVHTKQQRLAKDLQHMVTSTRMTEIGVLASRMQRNVHSTCQATGKRAELLLRGGETLIDGDVLNRLADPLLHILRNAVDHGVETPDERRAVGKPETGRIVLSFARQGQQVVLSCEDDGRGLDYVAIRRRAIERGMIEPASTASDEELARLILESGFSTRQSVNELSGRGVGLDVVREWAASMNGSVKIASRNGAGCTIELRFSASLSTMLALIVEVAGQYFALPSVQIEHAAPRGVGAFRRVGDALLYHHTDKSGEKVYPAVLLAELVSLPHDLDTGFDKYDAVLARINDKTIALAVERLVDARELLVKSPGRYAKHVRGVAGLSILGDGSVAVNLDMAQLLAPGIRKSVTLHTDLQPVVQVEHVLKRILIVDDSMSVRNSLLQMVQDAGYSCETARDGVEAVDVLRAFNPHVVLTDLEMPNMNGIELTSHIRGREDLKGLPVIMITSRSQDKHRRMAEQAGVNTYITKPYNDIELLQTIHSAIAA
jgi:chemotaxis protein histidine kinase CheA/ActR/RegA family two-component response regulator